MLVHIFYLDSSCSNLLEVWTWCCVGDEVFAETFHNCAGGNQWSLKSVVLGDAVELVLRAVSTMCNCARGSQLRCAPAGYECPAQRVKRSHGRRATEECAGAGAGSVSI